jgi:anthranilate phosphoribosyltransferase
MMGVYSRDLVEPLAHVLKELGLRRALVVHGNDGLDEITTTGKTFVSEFNGNEVIAYDLDPEEFGIQRASAKDLRGGDLATNITIVEEILSGKRGPARDIVTVNAAYALYTAQAVERITDGIYRAHDALDSGLAKKKLKQLKEFTQNVG